MPVSAQRSGSRRSGFAFENHNRQEKKLAVERPLQIDRGMERLLEAYSSKGGGRVAAPDLHFYEVCRFGGARRASDDVVLAMVRSTLTLLRDRGAANAKRCAYNIDIDAKNTCFNTDSCSSSAQAATHPARSRAFDFRFSRRQYPATRSGATFDMARKKLSLRAQDYRSHAHVQMVSDLSAKPRESLSDALAAIKRPGSFAVRREVSASDLVLEVGGVGPISLPVSQAKARALCSVASPARHGFKDQTRLDRTVRDTWEIPRTRLKIDQRRWKQALVPELDRIKSALGLAADCELRAELHNLLVYAPGQFFVPHQDTEKADGMIGTLVVTLPSAFSGGAIVIKHHDEKVEFRGSSRNLVLVAFYADCHHEVRPVKTGYRIVLTYNLLVSKHGRRLHPPAAAQALDALESRVRKFFQTAPPPRWSGAEPEGPPDRLVYLLDHQYSQRGLGWNQMKNADAVRVASLREVAQRLDCDMALALADVHETWSCEDEGHGYEQDSWHRYDDAEDDAAPLAGSDGLPEPIELQESEVELQHFVDAKGKGGAASGYVSRSELCFTKPSIDMDPFESKHEGYMGNWGNTVDHWYHRAAVVLWPRQRTFVIRAKVSAKYALDELAKSLAREGLEAARGKAKQLVPFWKRTWHQANDPRLVDKTLRVALALDSPELARELLLPLSAIHLNAKSAPAAVDLLERYGFGWLKQVLAEQHSRGSGRSDPARFAWLSSFPKLIGALLETDSDLARRLARQLVADEWTWTAEQHGYALQTRPSEILKETRRLEKPLLGLMEGAALAASAQVHGAIEHFLKSAEYPLPALITLLETARARGPSALNLRGVEDHCVSEIRKRLAKPIRSAEDWSIAPPGRCKCQLCSELSRFLRAEDQVSKQWPLAADKRAHIHQILDGNELPVTHTTKRSGRPHTLVLVKTRALFEREAAERSAWQKALDSLTRKERDHGKPSASKGRQKARRTRGSMAAER
jgi:hypothetical protein